MKTTALRSLFTGAVLLVCAISSTISTAKPDTKDIIKSNLIKCDSLIGKITNDIFLNESKGIYIKYNDNFFSMLPDSTQSSKTYNLAVTSLNKIGRKIEGTSEKRFYLNLLHSFLIISNSVQSELDMIKLQAVINQIRETQVDSIKKTMVKIDSTYNKKIITDTIYNIYHRSVTVDSAYIHNQLRYYYILSLINGLSSRFYFRNIKNIPLKDFQINNPNVLTYNGIPQWRVSDSSASHHLTLPEIAKNILSVNTLASSDEYFGISVSYGSQGSVPLSGSLGGMWGRADRILLFAGIGSYFNKFNLEAGPVFGWEMREQKNLRVNGYVRLSRVLAPFGDKRPWLVPGLMYSKIGGVSVSLGIGF